MAIKYGNKFNFLLILMCFTISSFSFAEENHAGELGYCALCNTVIMDKIGFYTKPNDEYNELCFELSNNSKADIAFCDNHYAELKDKDITTEISEQIMEGVKRGWAREFVLNKWSEKQIDKYKQNFFNLKITKRLDDEETADM